MFQLGTDSWFLLAVGLWMSLDSWGDCFEWYLVLEFWSLRLYSWLNHYSKLGICIKEIIVYNRTKLLVIQSILFFSSLLSASLSVVFSGYELGGHVELHVVT